MPPRTPSKINLPHPMIIVGGEYYSCIYNYGYSAAITSFFPSKQRIAGKF